MNETVSFRSFDTGDEEYVKEKKAEQASSLLSPAPGHAVEDLVFKVTDREGKIVAGCIGWTDVWGCLTVGALWVDPPVRKRGIASSLLKEAERTAKKMGCVASLAETFDFQARGLYEKLGYSVYAVWEDLPKGHVCYSLQKPLAGTATVDSARGYEIRRGDSEDARLIDRKLAESDSSVVKSAHGYRNLNRKIVTADGHLIAAVTAGIGGWGCGFIEYLWVEETYRRRGFGSMLLRETERAFLERGENVAFTADVIDRQTDFFTKNGYTVIGSFGNLPNGHKKYWLRKDL